MSKFNIKAKAYITKIDDKYELKIDMDYLNHTEEFKEITEFLEEKESEDLGLIDLSYSFGIVKFNSREDVYKYLLEISKDLIELGVELEIKEKRL